VRSQGLWTVVVFFGGFLAFNLVARATDGESTAVQVIAQVVTLVVIIAGLVVFVGRRKN
jgi:hypothetical protein